MFLLKRDGVLGHPGRRYRFGVRPIPDTMKPNAQSKVFHIYPQTRMLKKEISGAGTST
jgi:hypothetical protein